MNRLVNRIIHLSCLFLIVECRNRPIIVSIRYDSTVHRCNGIILTESFAVTAASCVNTLLDDITIVTNSFGQSLEDEFIRKVDEIIFHPNWTNEDNKHRNNIALVHLSDPLDLTELPDISGYLSQNAKYSNLKILTQSKEYEVFLVDNNDPVCNEWIDSFEQQFCVRFQQENRDRSGDLLFKRIDNHWVQFGLLSDVFNETNNNYLGIYTRLEYYDKWIGSVIHSESSLTTISDQTIYECDMSKVSCGCSMTNVVLSSERFINGEEAIAHSWGMTVSIRFNESEIHSCTGSILTPSYILTSASCVDGISAEQMHVVAGMHELNDFFTHTRYVWDIYIHPHWNRTDNGSYQNDIAILKIQPPLPVDSQDRLSRTCVPYTNSLNETMNYPSVGSQLITVSWGSTQYGSKNVSNALQQISTYVMDSRDSNCLPLNLNIENQFCVEVQGAAGDLGSPVFQWKDNYWEQVGIASFRDDFEYNNNSIANSFTRLAYYTSWMESIVGQSFTTTTTTPRPTTPPIVYSCNKSSSCGCGQADVALVSSRIVGGTDAVPHSWPMMVSVRFDGTNSHSCGGTVLSKSYILTAAHCFDRGSSQYVPGVSVAVGMTNRWDPLQTIRYVDRVYIHPNFSNITNDFQHDVALLHVNQSFEFTSNSNVSKTCIHRVDPPLLPDQYPSNGTRLAVIGWGTLQQSGSTLPLILQQVQVFTIDNDEEICQDSIENPEIQFCAGLFEGGKDSCQGDSGGPIFQWSEQHWEQVGIVSYGAGCALKGFPGVYTRLSAYYDWIENILKRDGEHLEPSVNPIETTTSSVSPSTTTITVPTTSMTTSSVSPSTIATTTPANRSYKYKPCIYMFGLLFAFHIF